MALSGGHVEGALRGLLARRPGGRDLGGRDLGDAETGVANALARRGQALAALSILGAGRAPLAAFGGAGVVPLTSAVALTILSSPLAAWLTR